MRIAADDFLHPPEIRRRRGALSAEGYLRDAFDHDALRARCGARSLRDAGQYGYAYDGSPVRSAT